MHKALGKQSPEQSLHNTLFEMKLNHLISHSPGIFEDNWAYLGAVAPLEQLLLPFAWDTKAVHRLCPRGKPLVELWKQELGFLV